MPKIGLLNQAVLWHLKIVMNLCDRAGYARVAVHISEAIDALVIAAKSESELSEKDFEKERHVNEVLEMFEKYRISEDDHSSE